MNENLPYRKDKNMKKRKSNFEIKADDETIEWLAHLGDELMPKSKEALKKAVAAFIEYLLIRNEEEKLSEPQQAEDGKV